MTMTNLLRRWTVRFGGYAFFFAAVLLLAHAAYVEATQPAFGILVRARGAVQYQAVGSASWVRATERMRVNTGDKINTGPDGSAIIKLSPNNFISLQQNAQVTIAAMASRPAVDTTERVLGLFPARTRTQNIEVDLARGRAVSVLRGFRAQSTYALRTPVATAGVRGTVFSARVSWDRGVKQDGGNVQVDFSCSEGSVEIEGNQDGAFDPVTLGEGQSFSVSGNEDGSGVEEGAVDEMSSDEVDEMDEIVDEASDADVEDFDDAELEIDDDDDDDEDHHYYY